MRLLYLFCKSEKRTQVVLYHPCPFATCFFYLTELRFIYGDRHDHGTANTLGPTGAWWLTGVAIKIRADPGAYFLT